jgi:hypothetical protein
MSQKRIPQAGDYIKTVNKESFGSTWRGKIRRHNGFDDFIIPPTMYLIEWSYMGGLPTDICTWVLRDDIVVTRRPKVNLEK